MLYLSIRMKKLKVVIIITEEEEIIEGIIIDADYGFGMKYKDTQNLYLKIEIQHYDGWCSTQLFRGDKIAQLLMQFKGDYNMSSGVKSLMHQTIYALSTEKINGVPKAIAKLPPSKYPQYQWIENDNWD